MDGWWRFLFTISSRQIDELFLLPISSRQIDESISIADFFPPKWRIREADRQLFSSQVNSSMVWQTNRQSFNSLTNLSTDREFGVMVLTYYVNRSTSSMYILLADKRYSSTSYFVSSSLPPPAQYRNMNNEVKVPAAGRYADSRYMPMHNKCTHARLSIYSLY